MLKKKLFYGFLSALLSLEAHAADFEVISDDPDADYKVRFTVVYKSFLIKEDLQDIITLESPNKKQSESLIEKLSGLKEFVQKHPEGSPLGISIKLIADDLKRVGPTQLCNLNSRTFYN